MGAIILVPQEKNKIRNKKEWVIVKFSSAIDFTEIILHKWFMKLQGEVLIFLLEEWRGLIAKICALSLPTKE